MTRRFATAATLGTLGALVGLAVFSPAVLTAQEDEERERTDEAERQIRIVGDAPLGLRIGGRAGGFVGIRMADVDDEAVERLGLSQERGVRVVEVVDDSPAAEAGLRTDDVIVAWNGERVESAAAFSRLVRETPAGRTVRLGVVRDGSEREIPVELGEPSARGRSFDVRRMPEGGVRFRTPGYRGEGPAGFRFHLLGRPRLGVAVTGLSEQLGEYFGAEDGDGALITSVESGTPAERGGLRAGDVILSVGGEDVEGPGDITRILHDREAGPVEVRILRERQERTVTVELEELDRDSPGGAAFLAPGLDVQVPDVPALHLPPMPPMPALEEWSDEWSEEWAERLREWGESFRFEPIEVTHGAGPVLL